MSPLIYPAAFYVLYIFGLFLSLMVVRVRAVKSGRVRLDYFATYSGAGPPEWMVVLGRHYDNQLQLPVLFLVTCVAHLQTGSRGPLTPALAWCFVVSRLVHSFVHLRSNVVVRRLQAYAIGWLAIIGLWLQLLLAV